ncbi:MAG: polysaccharide deacetylase family protein [Ginsengibacter sp.]
MTHGNFIISLDFELMWGVRDKRTKESYGANVIGVQEVIPRLLSNFRKYDIKATFSTVGFLFFNNKDELLNNLPVLTPSYDVENLSPYNGYFDTVSNKQQGDLYHFAPSLINQIKAYPEQEIGTHTFSHYYCLEKGQTTEQFECDLEQAISTGRKNDIVLSSLVFPRNQFNDEYLKVCAENGIICYRGNERSWLYKAKNKSSENIVRRGFRLMDAYLNFSGHNCYSDDYMKSILPINIPASRFLRPYSTKARFLERLKLQRITSGMTYAAKKNLTYHLWWHPHNFGINQNENFTFLENILTHYRALHENFFFQSLTMKDLAERLMNEK